MNRTIIAPIVAFILIFIKIVFGVDIPDAVGGQITDVILSVITLGTLVYGIFKNHQQ